MLRFLFKKKPRDPNNPLVLDFVPSLVSTLIREEGDKGEPLTSDEVLAVRDKASCIRVPFLAREDVWIKRGYRDVNPERVWEEWQAYRTDQTFLDL